jgi:hypothetical protein
MKKYLAVFGAALFVMALAAPAMAQFSSWGHMEIQTVWEERPNFDTMPLWANNTSGAGLSGGTAKDVTWRHVAERFRFYLQYGDPKTVRAVIGFEADSQDWGEPRTSGTVTGGRMGAYTADTVQLEIKHAYLDFMVPNTPVQVTAGVQDWAYGGRLLINNDGTGVKIRTNFAPHALTVGWLRFNDNNRFTYGVRDGYFVDWKMVQKAFDVNVYGAYVNDLWTGQQATFTDPVFLTGIPIANQFNQNIYYFGASAGFRPGNWTFFLHGLYAGGTREFAASGISDSDISAYALEALVKYQIGPGMAALVEGFYASGNDADSADDLKYFPVAESSEARSIFGNDRTVFFWMNAAQIGYYHNNQIDFSGLYYGRAAFEYSPTAWLRFILNYLYIGDTSEGTPGTFRPKFASQAAGSPTFSKIVNSPKGSRQDKDEDFVGHEINLITTINIYKNFVYNIGLYYFIAGDVFDTATRSAEDSYGINTKLNYAF